MISWWRTTFDQEDIQKISDAISNEHISQGPVTAEFEDRLARALDIPYVLATTSGSVSMLMVMMALGIGRDDEVIVPNRTWIATAHAPMMLGAKVVLVDVLPDVPIIDPGLIREKISDKTKAIIPAHLSGRGADMEQIRKIASDYGLFVVEDAAQGLFSKNGTGYLGTQSDAGCFSMSVAKLIPSGQGGFITTHSKPVFEKLKRIRTHGVDDVIDVTYYQMGFNFKFTDLQASLGIVQLSRVEKRIDYMKQIYEKYRKALPRFPFLSLIPIDVDAGEIPLYIEVLCQKRDELVAFLKTKGIQTRPFYPDLNCAEHLKNTGDYPNARRFGEQGLVLPCGPEQPLDNIDCVLEALDTFGKSCR